ncbi:hypothetical protein JX266_013434 [Neoarthrinium moseri]|nr:hypothetical protein JX266_013434 [Neoarthrinium moseri]
MSGAPPPKPAGGLSLYADLLDPPTDAAASISRAPQVSQQALDAVKEQEAAAAKKPVDPSLRFQPIRRPQPKTQKPKATFPKAAPPGAPVSSGGNAAAAAAAPVKSTLADWAVTEEDEWMYAGEKRPRPRKNKKKKNNNAPAETDWDEIYDPSRPTNVDEYLRSDERIREVREWKAMLYRHRRPAKRQSSWDSDEEEDRPMMNQFAPPPSYSFAPPPASPPRAPIPDDKTGDDAYARRLALSQGVAPPPPPPRSSSPPPPPEPAHAELPASSMAIPPPPPPPLEPDASTISRAPVRYTQPPPASPPAEPNNPGPDAMDEDAAEPADSDATRTSRPGQRGFAARLMAKYGWSKGQGLGAEGTGIIAPIRVQVEKRKKRSDAEGGGWAEPGGRGRIIEPKANPNAANSSSSSETASKFGPVSNVIVLRHMLDNISDLRAEMEDGLGQEIGEECGDKYGRVERLYIDVAGGTGSVYIKFVDTVSALRAVNALDGRVFAGSSIEPRYYDGEMFEKGIYE